jgi:hypothetical protein
MKIKSIQAKRQGMHMAEARNKGKSWLKLIKGKANVECLGVGKSKMLEIML